VRARRAGRFQRGVDGRSEGRPDRRAARARRARLGPGSDFRIRRRCRHARGTRRADRGCRAAAQRARHRGVLPADDGGGQLEPGEVRRRALRPPRRDGDAGRNVRAHARRGVRARSETPRHPGDLRPECRVLRRVLRQSTAGAKPDPPRLRDGIRTGGRDCAADEPDAGVSARRTDQRSNPDVSRRCLHRRREPRGTAGRQRPVRVQCALPLGLQLVGPAMHDAMVLGIADAYERVTPWSSRAPAIPPR